jgi:hypothetical protein
MLPALFCFSYFSGRVSHFYLGQHGTESLFPLTSCWKDRQVMEWGLANIFPGELMLKILDDCCNCSI